MATNLLSATEVKKTTSDGKALRKLHDGEGLYLWVYLDGRKY
jgi:hypothetical protein